jgi:hypothetical protein
VRAAGLGVGSTSVRITGDYWKPAFFLLEVRGFDCELYNAAHVKSLPGRPKTYLLTELREGLGQVSGRMGARVATVADRDRRRGSAAGSVAAGGAAVRLA